MGVSADASREVLVGQLIESERRVRYAHWMRDAELSNRALDAGSETFDPLKAAVLCHRSGQHDEACWLIFLSVHFGQSRRRRWELAGHFYGRLGQGGRWDWATVSDDVDSVRSWLELNSPTIRAQGATFGNHRKYESLDGRSEVGTGAIIESYVEWVGEGGSHAERFARAAPPSASPADRFAALYTTFRPVKRFGRTGTFDYLTMLGKLGLADVAADSAHLTAATGPLRYLSSQARHGC